MEDEDEIFLASERFMGDCSRKLLPPKVELKKIVPKRGIF